MSRKDKAMGFMEGLESLKVEVPGTDVELGVRGATLIELANIGDMLELVAQEISRRNQ